MALALCCVLAACSKPPSDAGLALHQTVTIAAPGTADERRLQVLEDARITPALRALMWGGSKDPAWLLAQPGMADAALARSLAGQGFRRALLRLVDRAGTVLAERRLDCELGEIAEPALAQGDGAVWGIGDDCSTGDGDFAGLITRFLRPAGGKLRFEPYREPDGRVLELTLVSARRIAWHLVPHGEASLIHEVSSHPDFDDPRLAALKPGEPPPADIPWVVDYLTYRWGGAGAWSRAVRTERNADWSADDRWPPDERFPTPAPVG